MFQVLANRTYRHLFLAQVIALTGTGLATVALGLLAYDLAGANAGAVLGTALAIKMIAYVGVAPVASAFADRWPRRNMLVALDLVRAAVALFLPFVSEIWQVYVLIFVLQSASAAFTPTFQATIPDVLPDVKEYTNALSLSRLAYDLESLLSPVLAALLLTVMSFHNVFAGTVLGFLASAALVVSVALPSPRPAVPGGIYDRTTRGLRIYLATPRLRGLLAINLAVASAGALVIVNTVVIVRSLMGRPDSEMALALACFGGGSMIGAFALPRLLDHFSDRKVMLVGVWFLVAVLFGFAGFVWGLGVFNQATATTFASTLAWPALLLTWALLGFGYCAAQTPTGRLLRRSAEAADRPALFAAQFALSHACWLLTYPLAGLLGSSVGIPITVVVLAVLTGIGAVAAELLWTTMPPEGLERDHVGFPPDHPHLAAQGGEARPSHPNALVDCIHRR